MARTLALVACAGVMILSLGATPAAAAHVATGPGWATYPGCPSNSDILVLSGSSPDGVWWNFVVADVNSEPSSQCLFVGQGIFSGAWNPAVGGCMGRLCLTSPWSGGGLTTYTLRIVGWGILGYATLAIA